MELWCCEGGFVTCVMACSTQRAPSSARISSICTSLAMFAQGGLPQRGGAVMGRQRAMPTTIQASRNSERGSWCMDGLKAVECLVQGGAPTRPTYASCQHAPPHARFPRAAVTLQNQPINPAPPTEHPDVPPRSSEGPKDRWVAGAPNRAHVRCPTGAGPCPFTVPSASAWTRTYCRCFCTLCSPARPNALPSMSRMRRHRTV
jgi:hypothetical protein